MLHELQYLNPMKTLSNYFNINNGNYTIDEIKTSFFKHKGEWKRSILKPFIYPRIKCTINYQ